MKYYTEEQKEIHKFIKILAGLIIILVILYFITSKVSDNISSYKRSNNPGTIQYSNIIAGEILNRPDKEYYVLVFDSTDEDTLDITNKASLYKTKQNNLPLFTLDLSNELNKQYKAENSHYTANTVEDIKFSKTTLIKVKNGQIIKFIENVNEMESELK